MPRKGFIPRRESAPDPKYDSVLVTRFVNAIMNRGKRSIAEGAFYKAMGMIEQKTGQDAMTVLKQAINNVKPVLEVKSRRVGGANYQVPVEVRPERPGHFDGESDAREAGVQCRFHHLADLGGLADRVHGAGFTPVLARPDQHAVVLARGVHVDASVPEGIDDSLC